MIRLRSYAARLLALFVLPLALVVAGPVARATAATGPASSFSFSTDLDRSGAGFGLPTPKADCNGKVAYRITGSLHEMTGSLVCKFTQQYGADPKAENITGTTDVVVSGNTATGDVCEAYATTTTNPLDAAGVRYSAPFTEADCMADRICISGTYDEDVSMNWDTSYTLEHCEDISLDFPGAADSSCPAGNPKSLALDFQWKTDWGGLWKIDYRATFTRLNNHSWTVMPIWYRAPQVRPSMNVVDAYTNTYVNMWERGTWPTNLSWAYPADGSLSDILYTDQPDNEPILVGGMVYPSGTGFQRGDWGLTDQSRCLFWIGDKIRDLPDTDMDEPWADLNGSEDGGDGDPDLTPTPPPVEDTGCTFDLQDPTTWLEGGMCAVVGLLSGIWDTLKGVLGGILGLADAFDAMIRWLLDGLLDGLLALFVPERGISERADEVKSAYSGTFPFSIVSAVGAVPADLNAAAMTTPDGTSARGVTGSSCPDWTIRIPGILPTTNVVCDSNFTDAIRGARPFLAALMIAAAFWPLLRGVFYASMPVVKPAPTGKE